MDYKTIFGVLGGLGLFIYGMNLMGDGLQKAAGNKMKKILEVLISNRVMAILVGAGVTAIIQSSSATTVMVVGFVNAGLLNLFQAAGVIMGANIGTTMTAQLIAFKLNDVAPLVLAIGTVVVIFAKKKKTRDIGEIVLGFGILFVGMSLMESNLKPLAELKAFQDLILSIGHNPIYGVLVGLLMTATVQSSSATIGVLQALAGINMMPLTVALPILFGDNIGTCATALLACIGTNKNAKRTALIHLTFNIIGTVIFMLILGTVVKLIPYLGGDIKRQIANAHTMFNITNTLIQAPFIPLLVAFVNKIIPGKEEMDDVMTLKYLDKRLLETPSVAIGQLMKEILRMGNIALDNVKSSVDAIVTGNEKLIPQIDEREEVVNFLEREITSYMVDLSNTSLSEHQSEIVTSLFHVVNDIERVGDHADNLSELAQYKIDNELPFSEAAHEDIRGIHDLVYKAFSDSLNSLESFNVDLAKGVVDEIEPKVDELEKRLRTDHIDRLNKGLCVPVSGAIFLDIISNLERVGDHSENIAQLVIELEK